MGNQDILGAIGYHQDADDRFRGCPECGSPSGHNSSCPFLTKELTAQNFRLRAALEQCAAEWKSSPGTVMGIAGELAREFKRRQQIAADAISLI